MRAEVYGQFREDFSRWNNGLANEIGEDSTEGNIPYKYRSSGAQAEAFYVADRFAHCAVKLNDDRARDLLDRAMGKGIEAEDEQKYYDRLSGCAIRRETIDREFMRGSLAVHLLLMDEKFAMVPSARTKDELVSFLQSVQVSDTRFGKKSNASPQLGYQCQAAMVPSAAYRVIEQEAGSDEEAAALDDLAAKTPFCDQLFGDTAPSTWFARALLARGLYHWNRFREENRVARG